MHCVADYKLEEEESYVDGEEDLHPGALGEPHFRVLLEMKIGEPTDAFYL